MKMSETLIILHYIYGNYANVLYSREQKHNFKYQISSNNIKEQPKTGSYGFNHSLKPDINRYNDNPLS